MARVAIVGGGISGLAVAYELTRRGHRDFVLYEALERLGGIVETVRQDGFVIECGPDSWVTDKPWARELAVELGLESEIIPSNDAQRRTYLLEGDHLTPMPDGMRMMVPTNLEAIASSPLFTEETRRGYQEEPGRAEELKAFAAARPPEHDESVATFVERHFGREVTEKIAAPLLAGVFGGDIRQLSAPAVMAPFVRMEREYGSLVLGLQQQRTAAARPVFTTLKDGLQTLIDAIVLAIPADKIRLRESVLSLTRHGDKWILLTSAGSHTFDAVVLATPVHVTSRLVAPWEQELQSLLAIEATSSVVAALAFDRKQSSSLHIPQGFGFLVPQRDRGETPNIDPELLACTFVDQKFANRTPEGCVLLRAFYGGASAPGLLDWTDEDVLDLARRQLSCILGEIPMPAVSVIRRWPRSLPQYTTGHRVRIARADEIVGGIAGLHLIGNAFHGVGLPDLVRQGRALAIELLSK